MPKSLPDFEPSYLKELCVMFWKNFRGKSKLSGGRPVVPWTKSVTGYVARYADESRTATIPLGKYLASGSETAPVLMSLLADIIQAKFNASPVNTLQVTQALMAYFQLYCTLRFQLRGGEMVVLPDIICRRYGKNTM